MHRLRCRYHRSQCNYHQSRRITTHSYMDEINVTIRTEITKSKWNHFCLSFMCLDSSPFLEYFLSQISQTNSFSGTPPCCLEHLGTCLTKPDFWEKVALQWGKAQICLDAPFDAVLDVPWCCRSTGTDHTGI